MSRRRSLFEDNNRVYLYRNGDECAAITGGWTDVGYTTSTAGYTYTAPVENTDNIDLSVENPSSAKTCFSGSSNKIDFTPYTKMGITIEIVNCPNGVQTYGRIGVTSNKTGANTNQIAVYNPQGTGISGIVTQYIDLSSVNGSYYVFGFVSANSGNVSRFKIKEVWIEK